MSRGDHNRQVTDEEIISKWDTTDSVVDLSISLGISERATRTRIARLRKKGLLLKSKNKQSKYYEAPGHWQNLDQHPGVLNYEVNDGIVLVGSDAHYYPNIISTAHRGYVHFAKKFQPKITVMNGDELDFPKLSRFAPIGWESRPNVIEEIETAKLRLDEIQKAAPNAKRPNPLGNHNARFETRLATIAPEYAKVHGVHLKDHFPFWEPCWAVSINESVIIKHRFKSGLHAPHNNTMWAGRTIITGHLHSLKVMPVSDYNGTRFGVDAGTMADPYGQQFYNYTEVAPLNWRSGFVVLTFKNGELLWPEVAFVRSEGVIDFRGELISV